MVTPFYITQYKWSKIVYILLIVICFLITFQLMFPIKLNLVVQYNDNSDVIDIIKNGPFLLNSFKCRIPDLQPINSETKQFMHASKYSSCNKNKPLLSYIRNEGNKRFLCINSKAFQYYSNWFTLNCCYQNISRMTPPLHYDDHYVFSSCLSFKDFVEVSAEFIKVACYKLTYGFNVYENTHAVWPIKAHVQAKLDQNRQQEAKPFSVLILAIDSVSRLSLIRNMPLTYSYLEANNWTSMKGYTKVGSNTLPNVLPLLTGLSRLEYEAVCRVNDTTGRFDECPFIWKEFSRLGYVTAYAEDMPWYSTFNFVPNGFLNEPTDYYFRPLMLANEETLKTFEQDTTQVCLGPETVAARILNLARNFTKVFASVPKFGIFWMNSFSHEGSAGLSGFDATIREFLIDFAQQEDDDTVLILLSDHGLSNEKLKLTVSGRLEAKLPLLYVSIPKRLQKSFPVVGKHLNENRNRLTSTFDLHMTLKHLLDLSQLNNTIGQAKGCLSCASIFGEIKKERSCQEAGVISRFCACLPVRSQDIGVNSPEAKELAELVVGKVNDFVFKNLRDDCRMYRLEKINLALSHSVMLKVDSIDIQIQTFPNASFEAYILKDENNTLVLLDNIERLDHYSEKAKCVNKSSMKKYCFCKTMKLN